MKYSRNTFFTLFVVYASLIFTSPVVHANLSPSAVGEYSGNISYSEKSCSSGPDSSETAATTLSITQLDINSFHGNGFVFFSDGETDTISLNIIGLTDTTFSFSWTSTGVDSAFNATGSGTGTLLSNGIKLTGSGSEIGGLLCIIDFDGTLSGSSDAFVPAVTPSSTVTDLVLFNTQIQSTISDISGHITGALSGIGLSGGPRLSKNQFKMEGATGLNAGDSSAIQYGVWGNYSYTNFENDLSSTAIDGRSHGLLGGVDFSFWENTIIGVALGYETGDIDTQFNGGNQETDSYTIAPYFGAILSDTWSIDFSLGYSNVEYDQFRTLPGTTTRVTSTPEADRWFGALNLNGVTYHNNWIFGGRIGASYARSTIGTYAESNATLVNESQNTVGTASAAADVAYSMQNNFEPFVNLSYQHDFSLSKISVLTGPQPSNDTNDFLLTLGVRYFDKNGMSGNIEYSKRLGREDFSEDRVGVTLRVDF